MVYEKTSVILDQKGSQSMDNAANVLLIDTDSP